MLPDPFDVLEATLGPAARVVSLEHGVGVVRTADRTDHAAGNALHHRAPVAAEDLATLVADLERRFPTGRARLVVPHDAEVAAAGHGRLLAATLEVLRRDAEEQGRLPGSRSARSDLQLAAPTDERDWHGITVLHRHAEAPGEDRSRGRQDDRLRWWVRGLQGLVGAGRARVLRAERFGTPVGAGVLYWAPGAVVGQDHAGLAVLADVVVHPAHRGIGIGRALSEALVAQHLADFPRACVTGVAARPGADSRAPAPDGWRHHATLLALSRGRRPGEA